MSPNLVEVLIRALGDYDIKKAVVELLSHLASSSTAVMEALLRVLEAMQDQDDEDPKWPVRCQIVRVLGTVSRSSKRALGAVLAAAMHDKVPRVRRTAIEVLRELGIREKPVVDVLISAAFDENFWVNFQAILALSDIGLISTDLKSLLIVDREQSYARDPGQAAVLGFAGIAIPESAEALVQVVQSKSGSRYAAMRKLGELSRSLPDLEPVILSGLTDADSHMCRAAADALARAGKQVPEAVPLLLANFRADSDYLGKRHRASAVWALCVVGPSVPESVAGLRAALSDQSGTVRRTAVSALGHLARSSSEEARSALKGCLQHRDPEVREIAVRNLGSAELWSSESLDILLQSVRDNSDSVRMAAAQMLRRALATQEELTAQVMPYVGRLTHWTSRPGTRSALLSVLATDPRIKDPSVDNTHIYNTHINRIASGLRSVFSSVRNAAYHALVDITRDRALPSFRWYTAAERQALRARRAWLVRLLLAGPITLAVFKLVTHYAENTYLTGFATLLALLLTVLPPNKIKAWLWPPPRR